MSQNPSKIIPVILCGGRGKRLSPLSRASTPKQFLKLAGNKSLLQQTIERAVHCTSCTYNNIVTVTSREFEQRTKQELSKTHPGLAKNLLIEDQAFNTAPAIALATHYVQEKFGQDALMFVLPTDHIIEDLNAFQKAIEATIIPAQKGQIVTFGIPPEYAETGYGHIRTKDNAATYEPTPVLQFTEKPDQKTAQKYLQTGHYFWNSGMFLFSVKTIAQNYQECAPHIWNFAKPVSRETKYENNPKTISPQSFDKAILEKTNNCSVIPCDIGWRDIGSWKSLMAYYFSKYRLHKRKA
ncbi:MAG: mannose-1-phosphate guanylyltransferase [Alphaproteobacteria bacterium]|nr:mannose-1-phosphate guanylyltransferase [Alphaproteobacteria bacterium]